MLMSLRCPSCFSRKMVNLLLRNSCEKWAEEIAKSENYDRLNVEMHDSLFDIKNLAKRLEKFYIENNNKDGE